MPNYNVNTNKPTREAAKSDLDNQVAAANKLLEAAELHIFEEPTEGTFTIDCTLDGAKPKGSRAPTSASYDGADFGEVMAIAEEQFGEAPFKVTKFAATLSYAASKKQIDAMRPAAKRSPPAGERSDSSRGADQGNLAGYFKL